MQNFEKDLNNILALAKGYKNDKKNCFERIYPFSNENIKGYYKKFNFNDKNLLTVGSSCDQTINALYNGCRDITIYDVCPWTKYYYYLKTSAIISLSYQEYISFFYYDNNNHQNYFNYDLYKRIARVLKIINYESYILWNEVIKYIPTIDIKENIFSSDFYSESIITRINPYLKNATKYLQAKNQIMKTKVNFVNGNLFDLKLRESYDNIWLSNIFQFSDDLNKILDCISKLYSHLNDAGNIMVSYLYETSKENVYYTKIYNLLKQYYNLSVYDFNGATGYLTENKEIKDSVLILKK